MKKILKRGLSLVLTLIMIVGLLPVTAFAAVDSSGKPTDLNNTLVLSIYTPEGSFPGEPAMHGSADYISFNSSFAKTSASGKFKDNATTELNTSVLDDMVQGASNGNNTVWGVFSADGLKEKYFKPNASIIQPANEAKIIRVIKGNAVKNMTDEQILDEYEIIWYVIKLQHSPGNGWWNRGTTEWHIDGLIREKSETLVSINYYGNGNTEGAAPDGITNHVAGDDYTVLGSPNMKRKINGVYVDFLGWSAKADGTGEEAGFYKAGDVIKGLDENISLYAMWDTTTQYTATVNTYLDDVLTDDSDIHNTARNLYLGTEGHYYQLTRSAEGVYSVKITGNGKFQLYNKDSSGAYTQIGTYQLTIYNQNASLDVHHYSVTYNPNEGEFAENPGKQAYTYGEAVTAVKPIPTRTGYRFLGWKDNNGSLIQPGEEVTASIDKTIVLEAQWEKTVNVTVNVTINHEGGGGHDQMASKDNVSLALVSRANDESPYLEVVGKTLELDNGATNEEQRVTQYLGNTFTDMPGGTVDYTVVTSKSGYDTTITPTQDEDGNWVIDVVMTYNPSNFDLDFTVEIADSVPARYIPDAAIVKVTFWSTDRHQWEIITQQEGGAPGVRVDIDPATRSGSGSYPVWKYESNGTTPYGYRIQITSFVYPDGTIVPASQVVTQDVAWTDTVYTATVQDVTGGKKFGTLDGAYIGEQDLQVGKLNAVITMDLHNVTFDAQGGKVNGADTQTVTEQYQIPSFKNYVPTRDGGYTFGGWYEDAACTVAATEGKDLTKDITLYAKWIEPLTVSGTVSIAGSYDQNGVDVPVNGIDRAMEAVVVLQELRDGHIYEVDSKTVKFKYGEDDDAAADYSFTGIPNDGKNYQIHVLVLNYGTAYDNESDTNNAFTPDEYTAVFGGDNVADVDAHLTFVPPSYDQPMRVDATQISENFRPQNVLAEVMYRDTGDNHPFNRISQHNVDPYGVKIGLTDGIGTGTQSIWKWHTDGMLYDYQMNISQVDGKAFNSDTAPYYITYAAPAYWDGNTNAPSGALVATLIPKRYLVSYDLNADGDVVTGVDKLTYQDEEGNTVHTDTYGVIHTWSFDTAITAVPQREGYTFKGWTADVEGVYVDGKIPAAVHQEVTLTAQWELNAYTVTTVSTPNGYGTTTGDGTYDYGTQVVLTATANPGYTFVRWLENGNLVSYDPTYTIEKLTANREFVAEFSMNQYHVSTNADPEAGGTTSGSGVYNHGASVTVSATANSGYTFAGWYENGELVSAEAEYQFNVSGDREFTAKFDKKASYQIVANAAEGGTATGGGTYIEGTTATLTAESDAKHKFMGWYEEGELVCADEVYSFEVTGNRTLKAVFATAHTITTIAFPEGAGSLTGGGIYGSGEEVTIGAEANGGYCFVGWYDEQGRLVEDYTWTVKEDRTLTAKFVKKITYRSDFVYIFGYEDTQIGAEGPLLRGELAQMIYRLVRQHGESKSTGKVFADTAGQWFQSGMAYMEQVGAIDGRQENGYPNAPVSRGEAYKMICLGLRFTDDANLRNSQYATILRNHGFNTPEGTINGDILRWQFCQLFNDILGRTDYKLVDAQNNPVTHETYNYTDLDPSADYYNTMLIAASTFKDGVVVKRMERNTYDYTN